MMQALRRHSRTPCLLFRSRALHQTRPHLQGVEEFFPELMQAFEDPEITGPITCLNMYKFKNPPEYPDDYAGLKHATGREAWEHYAKEAIKAAKKHGAQAEIMYYGQKTDGMPVWHQEGMDFRDVDAIAIVRYGSKEDMLRMASSSEYQEVAAIREAAVLQSWASFSDGRDLNS